MAGRHALSRTQTFYKRGVYGSPSTELQRLVWGGSVFKSVNGDDDLGEHTPQGVNIRGEGLAVQVSPLHGGFRLLVDSSESAGDRRKVGIELEFGHASTPSVAAVSDVEASGSKAVA